jgi:hypothetical protein
LPVIANELQMSRTKVISGCYGAIAVGLAIWLDAHGHDLSGQIFVLSSMAIAAPVALGMMVKGLRQSWFWIALICCVSLHLAFLFALSGRLPFDNGEYAIILGAFEMLALTIVTAKIMDSHPSGREAAAEFAERYERLKSHRRAK